MDEKPRNLKAMISEANDTSEIMIDLADAALFFSNAGVDILLVGDSVSNNVLGYEDALHIDTDVMAGRARNARKTHMR